MPRRQRALRIEVQICAPKPSQYRWEIYDGDELDDQAVPIDLKRRQGPLVMSP
jgi:hypothetical protein